MVAASLVIPAFNEADNIDPFMKRVKDTFNPEEYDLECIFIDDGSSDDTYSRIKKAVAEYTEYKVKGIRFSRNFGKESAILAGLEHSSGDYISIIDADLQQDPKYVLQMIDILENDEEYDAVACYQASRREERVGFQNHAQKRRGSHSQYARIQQILQRPVFMGRI